MSRTVPVTGARGFIGAATVRKLAGLPDTKSSPSLAHGRPTLTDQNIHWIESSLEELRPSHWQSFEIDVPRRASFTWLPSLRKSPPNVTNAQEIISANVVGHADLARQPASAPRAGSCSAARLMSTRVQRSTIQ